MKEFNEPACAVIKHTNPCGAATGSTITQAFIDAWEGDPVSAFGSIIGFNRILDLLTAKEILSAGFIECIIATGYEEDALDMLKEKKNLRILETGKMRKNEVYDQDMKRIVGGILIQERDLDDFEFEKLKVVTRKNPTDEQLHFLLFAWNIVKNVKSNAIVIAQGTKTVGIGAGQMSRIDAAYMALSKSKARARDAVLASDAFFPKPDVVQLAAEHGIAAIIQPGGSIKDSDSIRACDEAGVAMVFTGFRHFKH